MRKRIWLIPALILVFSIAAWFLKDLLKIKNQTLRPLPHNRQKAKYSYYRVIDEKNGELLTYISSTPVYKGDEYVTGQNRRYIITRLEGNTAYARYAGTAK